MLCATQCPPPPCIPPDALVFDYENMLEPGFSVSSQQKNVREEFKCRIMQSSMHSHAASKPAGSSDRPTDPHLGKQGTDWKIIVGTNRK